VEKACKDADKKLDESTKIDLDQIPSQNIKQAIAADLEDAVKMVKEHKDQLQSLNLKEADNDAVMECIGKLSESVTALGDLTKSTPKRKVAPEGNKKTKAPKKPKK